MTRLCTENEAATDIGLDLSVFRHWVKCGRLPSPLDGTDKFDLKAIHAHLDALSGLGPENGGRPGNPLDAWKAKQA